MVASLPAPELTPLIPHWIDGGEHAPDGARTAVVSNPATGTARGRVVLADDETIARAIASARRGYTVWSEYSIAKRQGVLFAFRELLNSRK